ncbi:hypothetical protein H6F67_03835 [Microcoleus sp. FACHB-1515]|uniref:hypothetical protein n=1 Tax=Cyanophyceae TaxID=3028117 RepID=UPI00168A1197|nr:hypothetical protein [Microcoleus sp. FACHB-1515]MBD2088983.1 hypothetical protein [Microcoleus sp. FACHB-1515]
MLELWQAQLWTALPVMQIAPVVNTPQTFVAIVAGLVMAIAFQLLVANLGIAIGVTALGLRLVKKADAAEEAKPEKSSSVGTIGLAAGLGILLTINVVLFAACFLAGKLSLAVSPFVGGIIGVVIWAAYFLLLLWLSSSAVTSIVGLILGSATSGLRSLVSAISAVLSKKDDSPYMTETAAMNAIRQEVRYRSESAARSTLKSDEIQDALRTYVSSLPTPQLDLSHVGSGLELILKSPEVLALAGTGLLGQINRQTFVDLLRDRHDLSAKDAHRVVDHLESVWQQSMPRSNSSRDLINLLKSTRPEDLQQILAQSKSSGGLLKTIQQNIDFDAIRRTLISRVDLSDLDIEQIWQQLRSLRQDDATEEAKPEAKPELNSIAADLEAFLLSAYSWQLQSDLIPATLRDILYDPEADPEQVRERVEAVEPDTIAAILAQREDFSEAQIDRLVQQFETVRQEVLETARTAAQTAELDAWRSQLEAAWQANRVQDGVRSLLSVHPAEQVDRAALTKLLADRADAPVDEWVDHLEAEITARQAAADAIASELWQKLKPYFRYTKVQQLTFANVQRKLETTLAEIEPQLADLPTPKFDWDKLEAVLKRRKSMSSEQLEQILTQTQQIWADFTSLDRRIARSHQAQIDRFIQTMHAYLLLPESDRPDLKSQLQQAGIELATLRQLRSSDWHLLQSDLQKHLDSADVQPQMQQARFLIRQIIKPPRRWATRRPRWNFSDQLRAYLQQSNPTELDALQANLSRLIADAADRNIDTSEILQTPFDRALLTEALAQRPDFEQIDVEALLDRLENARSQLWQDAQQQQSQLQSAFEALQAKLKQYLGSIALPDLNYDSMKQDIYKLLSLPQAGIEKIESLLDNDAIDTWRDRLGQLNRDAIETMLQARDDFSQAVSSRVVEQFEGVRSQVAQQIEQVQQAAQRRLDEVKQQAQRRAEETRRAAAIAAWWLFCTAITSLTTAAVAGTLGVTGIHLGSWSL